MKQTEDSSREIFLFSNTCLS